MHNAILLGAKPCVHAVSMPALSLARIGVRPHALWMGQCSSLKARRVASHHQHEEHAQRHVQDMCAHATCARACLCTLAQTLRCTHSWDMKVGMHTCAQ
eukprot:8500982-Alexandrium_andersonii.AAC.1